VFSTHLVLRTNSNCGVTSVFSTHLVLRTNSNCGVTSTSRSLPAAYLWLGLGNGSPLLAGDGSCGVTDVHSRYSDLSLNTGRGKRLQNVQTGPGAHPASIQWAPGFLVGRKAAGGVKLISDL